MANFHCSTRVIGRKTGRSAVAASAYRSGSELVDQRTGLVHNYTRRAGVVSAEIVMPDGGTADRAELWNAAEAAEKRKDSRTAREWILALPVELDDAARKELTHSFAGELSERYGVAVDVAIHRPDTEGDQRNHHAHLLMTTRDVSRGATGIELGAKTALELGNKDRAKAGIKGRSADDIVQFRERWADLTNHALERAGRSERVDHRSLAAQGIDREATTHLGPVATDMERRGKASDRGDGNREVAANNVQREQLTAQIIDLRAERERRSLAAKDKSAAEIRQDIEQYKRKHGPQPFMRVQDLADRSLPVTKANDHVRQLVNERDQAKASKQRAEQEAQDWAKQNPMRARMAGMGLGQSSYLDERKDAVKAADRVLEAIDPKIEQAQQVYLETRQTEVNRLDEKYQPQRDWVAKAEGTASERERSERQEAARAIQREAEERRNQRGYSRPGRGD